jgi:hypothetical protein
MKDIIYDYIKNHFNDIEIRNILLYHTLNFKNISKFPILTFDYELDRNLEKFSRFLLKTGRYIIYEWCYILRLDTWSKRKKFSIIPFPMGYLINMLIKSRKKVDMLKLNYILKLNNINIHIMDKIIKEINETKIFPRLYKIDKKGKIRTWYIGNIVEWDDGTSSYVIIHGLKEGKKIRDIKNVEKGVRNQTSFKTAFENAKSDFKKMVKNNKYSISIEKAINLLDKPTPMLAYKWNAIKNKDPNAIWIGQPKLDGTRMLAKLTKDGVVLTKRGGDKIKTLKRIENELLSLNCKDTIWIDGEVYKHGGIPQTDINSVINSDELDTEKKKDLEKKLEFHIYDMYNSKNKKMIYKDRYNFIRKLVGKKKMTYLKIIENITLKDVNEHTLKKITQKLINKGYEGLIIRNENGLYVFDRSKDLYKYKIEEIDDAKIIKIYESKKNPGRFGLLIMVEDKKGRKFPLTANGTVEYRKKILKNKKMYIDKKIRFVFYGFTSDNIPKNAHPKLDSSKKYIIT